MKPPKNPRERADTAQEFTTLVTGLQPGATYYYRMVARNTIGTTYGTAQTLITPPAEPTVDDQPPFATGVAPHEATLHGTINPGQGITTYHFIYGPTAGYGSSTPEVYTQLSYEDAAVEQLITGLIPDSTYHYALVATNSSGTATGPDQTFTTLLEPVVEAGLEQPPSPPAVPATLTLPLTPALLPPIVLLQEQPVRQPRPAPESRAQKLAKALRQCAKQPKKTRAACIKKAKNKYGPTKKKRK